MRVHINEALKSQGAVIKREMDYAIADTSRWREIADRLQLRVDREALENPVPGAGPESTIRLGEVVNLKASFKLEKGYYTFSGEFQPNVFLTLLYEPLGLFDYSLVVRDFVEIQGEDGERQVRGLLRFYPLDGHGRAIPAQGEVPVADFRWRTAKYVLQLMERGRENPSECMRVLCYRHLPDNLESLEATVDAFEFLSRGRADSRCLPSETDEACIERIEATFEEVLEAEPTNGFARLGLGLAQLRHSQILMPKASAVDAGRFLMNGVSNISSAKQSSPYLRQLMSTKEWTELVSRTPGLENSAVSPEFVETADAYREARRAFAAADFAGAVRALDQIKRIPTAIEPHIRTLLLSAKLLGAQDADEAEPLIYEFGTLLGDDPDSAEAASYALVLCRWNRGDPSRISKALSLMDDAIGDATDSIVTLLDRRAQKGICLALVGRIEEAIAELHSVADDLMTISDPPSKGYERVCYNLGIGFVQSGEQKLAAKFFGYAVLLEPIYLKGISRLNFAEPFRKWRGYKKWSTEHVPRP